MNLLGRALKDSKPVRIALQKFKGIGPSVSQQICRRLQLHDGLLVSQLSETQLNSLTALLSEPTSQKPKKTPIASFPGFDTTNVKSDTAEFDDGLHELIIGSDLTRQVRANIAHHRNIGSYKGRRHAMGYPVRGQRTQTNARTAKHLNRLERSA